MPEEKNNFARASQQCFSAAALCICVERTVAYGGKAPRDGLSNLATQLSRKWDYKLDTPIQQQTSAAFSSNWSLFRGKFLSHKQT